MSERIPRRMRRFYREGRQPPAEGIELPESQYAKPEPGKKEEMNKQITMQLALDEVQSFKQKHKRLPKKEEYDRIAESIYKQLKDQEKRKETAERLEEKEERLAGKAGRLEEKAKGTEGKARALKPSERARLRRERKGKGLPKEEARQARETAIAELRGTAKSLGEKEIKGLSVKELFGTEEKEKKAAKPAEDEFSLGGLTDLEAEEETGGGQQNRCPKCQAITENVIFCPECGTAFCKNCAKRVQAIGKTKTFVCPGCKAKIKK